MADQPSIADSLQPAPQMSGGMTPNLPLAQPLQLDNRVGRMQPMAQAIQSQGRGNDSMLVHMTPGEVSGLNALAMQNFGQPLTINPATGLPEAGLLESLLPTIAGIGLSMIPGVGPMLAAGIVGGGTALMTGDLGKGLMAGLGAYGGANIGSALSGAGAANIGAETTKNALIQGGTEQVAADQVAQQMLAENAAIMGGGAGTAGSLGGATAESLLSGSMAYPGAQGFAAYGIANPSTNLAMEGVKGLGSGQGWSNLADASKQIWANQGTAGKIATATGIAAPLAQAAQPAPMEFPTGDEGYQMNYEGPYLPTERRVTYPGQDRRSTSEYQYFTPSNPIPYADGGEVDYNFKPEYRPASGFMPSTGSKGGMTPSTERMGSPTGGLASRAFYAATSPAFLNAIQNATGQQTPSQISAGTVSRYPAIQQRPQMPAFSPFGGLGDDSAFRALQGMSPAFGMLGGNAQLPATPRPQPNAPIRYAEPRYSFDKLGGYTTPPSSGKGGMPPVRGGPALPPPTIGPVPPPTDPFTPTFGTVGTSPGNARPLGPSSGVPANQFWETTFSPAQKFAEGGETDRAIKFAGADYQGGVDPEFGHGFKPVQIQGVDFGGNVASAGNVVPEFFSGKGGKMRVDNPVIGYTSSGDKIYQYGSEADYLEANPFGLFGGKGGRMDNGNNGIGTVMGRALSRIARKKSDSDADLSSYNRLEDLQYNPMTQRMERMADGGEVRMEDGGFVMDARSVSEIGNGSSNAGLEKLSKLGARPLQGRGDGVSDSIPANIGGSQKARVARDEAYFSPAAVEKLGGSQKLYAMMDKAHKSRKNAKRGQDTGGLKALMA